MRKVTEKTVKAMRGGYNLSSGNTTVHSDGNVMDLFGNTIAIYNREDHLLTLRDCGWQSATTKERLNGILDAFGLGGITQKNGKWFYTEGYWQSDATPAQPYAGHWVETKRVAWGGSMTFDLTERAEVTE